MTKQVRVTDASQLDDINGLIHDFWFDYDSEDAELSGVNVDRPGGVLEIEYRWEDWRHLRRISGGFLRSRLGIPAYRAYLRVHQVQEAEIEDRAGIGGSSFNRVRYDPGESVVCIDTNIPIDIEARVRALEVSVEITDESVGEVTAKEYLGGLMQSGPNQ